MPPRNCRISVTDARGIRHSVDVQAESLFEAAVLGIRALREAEWFNGMIGGSTRLEIEVHSPITRHTLTLLQLERWLDGATPSPNERVKKDRLKRLLATG